MFPIAMVAFRDGLEATLFIGIIAAAMSAVANRRQLITSGILLGLLGAVLLALASEALNRSAAGKNIFQLVVLTAIFAMLLWHVIWASQHARELVASAKNIGKQVSSGQMSAVAVITSVAMIMLREGSEIILFALGADSDNASLGALNIIGAVLIGLIGAALVGGLMYAGLLRIKPARMFSVTNAFVILVAAGIFARITVRMVTMGWLPTGAKQFWDSSWLASDDGILGLILHGIMGYDAKPSAVKLAGFVAGLAIMMVVPRLMSRRASPSALTA